MDQTPYNCSSIAKDINKNEDLWEKINVEPIIVKRPKSVLKDRVNGFTCHLDKKYAGYKVLPYPT